MSEMKDAGAPDAVLVEEEATPEPGRTLRQSWTLAALAVVLVVLPGVLGAVLSGGAAVAGALVCVLAGPLVLGIVDGAQFRVSWTFPIVAGVLFWFAKGLYFQDAAWVYVLPVVLLAWGGGVLGAKRGEQGLGVSSAA